MIALDLPRGSVARFVPEARSYAVTVLVEDVTMLGKLAFVHGRRCDAAGVLDSQARSKAWPVRLSVLVEVVG